MDIVAALINYDTLLLSQVPSKLFYLVILS